MRHHDSVSVLHLDEFANGITHTKQTHSSRAATLVLVAVLGAIPFAVHAQQTQPASAAGAASPPAGASSSETTGLEEVIVVARRVQEREISVPITINVLAGDDLERQQIYRTDDLAQRVPALQVVVDAQQNNSFTIRGVGRTFQGDDGVVTYVAEVPQGVYGGAPLYDLQSIEVLKGPQGTLFGKNAVGGAVLLVPERPKLGEFGGFVSARGGNFDTREFTAAINLPVNDVFAVRIAARDTQRDAIIENVAGPNLNNLDRQSARISLLYKPNDSVENLTIADGYTSHETVSLSGILGAVGPLSVAGGTCPPTSLSVTIPCLYALVGKPLSAALAQQQGYGIDRVAQPGVTPSHTGFYGLTNTTTLNHDDFTVKNIIAYREVRIHMHADLSGFDPVVLATNEPDYHRQFTEELQLRGSAFGNRLDWVVGGFYSDSDDKMTNSQTSILKDLTVIPGIPAAPTIVFTTLYSRSTAVFGQSTYDLSDFVKGLKFTAGIRNTWDKREFVGASYAGTQSLATCLNQSNGVFFPDTDPNTCLRTLNSSYTKPTWNVNLEYQVLQDTFAYVATERGYKSGSFNPSAVGTGLISYQPETLTNYEVGIKSEGRVAGMPYHINLAFYTGNYNNIQEEESILQNNQFGVFIVNVGKATIRGFETEFKLVPLPGLEIGGFYALTDGKYADDTTLGPLFNGKQFLGVAKTTAAFNAQYTHNLPGEMGAASVSGSLHYTGPFPTMYVAVGDPAFDAVAGYTTIDAALDWQHIFGHKLDLRFYAQNLTDKRAGTTSADEIQDLGYATRSYLEPRMYGAEVTFRF